MSKETLLEKAKKVKVREKWNIKLTEEEIELALGWLKDEVTLKQIIVATKGEYKSALSGNQLYWIANAIREAYRKGKLKLT